MKREHFLDGLRGWAAVNVVIVHVFFDVIAPIDVNAIHPQVWWPASGALSVALFFVVSGYALSINFVRSRNYRSLARMAAGRYVRLTIPILALSSIVTGLLLFKVILPSALPEALSGSFKFELTFSNLLRFSLYDVYFNYDPQRSYAGPLWTMSYELIGSALVFALLFSTAYRHRILCMLAAMALFLWSPLYTLFVVGVVCASSDQYIKEKISERAALASLVLGLLIWRFAPENGHLLSLAATAIFVGILASSLARQAFSTPFSRVLGQLSFPLYLVHAPVLFAVGIPLQQQGYIWLGPIAALLVSVVAALAFVPVNNLASLASRRLGLLLIPRQGSVLSAS